MKSNFRILFPLYLLVAALTSCTSEYEKSMQTWQSERFAELSAPYGWPSVVGLYWVRNSIAYFGGRNGNDFLIPGNAPSFGRIMNYDTAHYMIAHRSLRVQVNGETAGKVRMLTDKEKGGPTKASWKSYKWHLIERGDKTFLRMQDSLSPYRSKLLSIPYYSIDETWKVQASFIPADSTDLIEYNNVLDMTFKEPFSGYLEFELNGEKYKLKAMDNDEESYFLIFSDETNGEDTYGGGRYIYPSKADDTGMTYIDFNKSINPPCVFTPYATCPLPPKENHIDIAIVAGEKMVKMYQK